VDAIQGASTAPRQTDDGNVTKRYTDGTWSAEPCGPTTSYEDGKATAFRYDELNPLGRGQNELWLVVRDQLGADSGRADPRRRV
jgi:hypothetical protein